MADAASDGTLPSAQPSSHEPETGTNTTTEHSQQQAPSDGTDPLDVQQEASLDAEINPESATAEDATDSSIALNQNQAQDSNSVSNHPAVVEPRIPQKKDASLREFMGKMDDYAPLVPDAVTDYYLTLAGLPPPPETDRRLARLLALATQKFVADIAADAYQYSRIRSTNTTSNNPMTGLGGAAGFGTNMPTQTGGDDASGAAKGNKKDAGKSQAIGGPRAGYGGGPTGAGGQGRTVLTMEDLGMAVGEYGVNVKRGEFYR